MLGFKARPLLDAAVVNSNHHADAIAMLGTDCSHRQPQVAANSSPCWYMPCTYLTQW
jgi:hypothetical protein